MKHSRTLRAAQAGITLAAALALIAGAHSASAQTPYFSFGDLIVSRVGTGSGALTNSGTAAFLDEFNTTSTSQTASKSLNLTTSGTNPFVLSGTATSEGFLTLSTDGKFLTISGYDATAGTGGGGADTKIADSTAASVPREIAVISSAGAVNTATTLGADFSGNNPRGTASPDGATLIVGGATGGIFSTTTGTAGNGTPIETVDTNIRNVNLFGGNTYFSSSSGTYKGIYQVGGTASTTPTLIVSDATTGGAYDFYFTPDGNTLYVADNTTASGILKFTKSGGAFGTGVTIGGAKANLTGLTGVTVGGVTTLFAVNGTNLLSLTDTGTPTYTTLATAPANEAFRGVDFAPSAGNTTSPAPEPGEMAVLSLCGLGLGGVILRRRMKKTADAAV